MGQSQWAPYPLWNFLAKFLRAYCNEPPVDITVGTGMEMENYQIRDEIINKSDHSLFILMTILCL